MIECGRSVVYAMLSITYIGTVDLKLNVTILHVYTTRLVGRQKLNGVIKGKFLGGTARLNHLLSLGYEHVLGCVRESGTLVSVEVNELSMNFIIGSDTSSTPSNSKLYVMVL